MNQPMETALNGVAKGKWTNDGTGNVLTVQVPKRLRKLRRAMTSRRWEKKMIKAVNAMMGFEALKAVRRYREHK